MSTMQNKYTIAAFNRTVSFTESLRCRAETVWNTWDPSRARRVLPGRFNTELLYALDLVSPERVRRYHTATPVDTLDHILALLGDLRKEDTEGRDWGYQLERISALCLEYRETQG